MTHFGPAGERKGAGERERGWNVLKAETFLIVHSHRPYVTQTDHVTQLCSSPWEAKALSPPQWLPRSKPDYASPLLTQQHTDGQTDGKTARSTDRATDRERHDKERRIEMEGLEWLRLKQIGKRNIYIAECTHQLKVRKSGIIFNILTYKLPT